MPTLIEIPLSPYAQKIKLALIEKGIAFDTKVADLLNPDPAFRAASPRLEVPVFMDGDELLFDSSVILEYLEDRWPESPLLPKAPADRARARTVEEMCDTAYDAAVWGMSEITVFRRAEGELATRMLDSARSQIADLNARLERELRGHAWFGGDRVGYGDVAAYPFVNGAAAMGNKPAAGGPLDAWLRAMRKRPSAERVKQDILATLADFMQRPNDVATGKHRRQYRDHRLDWMLRSGGLPIVLEGIEKQNIRFSEGL